MTEGNLKCTSVAPVLHNKRLIHLSDEQTVNMVYHKITRFVSPSLMLYVWMRIAMGNIGKCGFFLTGKGRYKARTKERQQNQ